MTTVVPRPSGRMPSPVDPDYPCLLPIASVMPKHRIRCRVTWSRRRGSTWSGTGQEAARSIRPTVGVRQHEAGARRRRRSGRRGRCPVFQAATGRDAVANQPARVICGGGRADWHWRALKRLTEQARRRTPDAGMPRPQPPVPSAGGTPRLFNQFLEHAGPVCHRESGREAECQLSTQNDGQLTVR